MIDVNIKITNPVLVDSIRKLKQGEEQKFITEIKTAKFLCPATMQLKNSEIDKDGQLTVEENTSFQIIGLKTQENINYLMAFTDWDELYKWKKANAQKAVIFEFEDYRKIVLQDDSSYEGFVINPFNENIIINKQLIINISTGMQAVQKGAKISIGLPKDYPEIMVRKLINYFEEELDVSKAYLLWMVRDNEASYLLVLDTDGEPNVIFPKVANVCRPYLNGKLLDILPIKTTFARSAVENQIPFYSI